MNTLFAKGRQAFLLGHIGWLDDDIRCALCTAKPDTDNDEFLSDLSVSYTSGALRGKTAEAGVAGAQSTVFSAVAGKKIEALVLFQDTGNPKNSRLIACFDDLAGVTFPFAPNGGPVQINWPSGRERIFRL